MRRINRKGQEEIVGFVLIIVLVAIVFLVFLGIYVRKGATSTTTSVEVYQFLESSMEYTSDCAVRFLPDYETVGELFNECYSGSNCLDGRSACHVLNKTVFDIFSNSWTAGPENKVRGYEFKSSYFTSNATTNGEEILALTQGNCSGSVQGASYLIPAFPGKIENSLKLCF